jgi:DNA repair protein RAD57
MNLTEITGESGSGKTNFCVNLMVKCALPKKFEGLEKTVLYITTVKALGDKRISQMVEQFNLSKKEKVEFEKRIIHKHCDYEEFEKLFPFIPEMITKDNIKMIIIDTITGLCDIQFMNENNELDYQNRAVFLKR